MMGNHLRHCSRRACEGFSLLLLHRVVEEEIDEDGVHLLSFYVFSLLGICSSGSISVSIPSRSSSNLTPLLNPSFSVQILILGDRSLFLLPQRNDPSPDQLHRPDTAPSELNLPWVVVGNGFLLPDVGF